MVTQSKKRIWQAPWGYPESFAVVWGLLIIGLALQVAIGSFDFYILSAGANIYVAIAIVLLSVAIGMGAKRSSYARWITGVPLAVAIVSALLLLTIVMGLTVQQNSSESALGLEAMTSNWAFVLIYTLTLISLGSLICKRLRNYHHRDIPFFVNHIGLWITLAASGLGYADMQRYIMYVNEGETEWRVYDRDSNIEELPIAITLGDFSVSYYPSKEVVVDTESGEVIHDTTSIAIGDRYRRVMSSPEPRRFSSEVEIYTEWGERRSATIEVNRPLSIGSWMIYQYGYDNAAGNRSSYSSFELVYDRWWSTVATGIIMMMIGSIMMIWMGQKIGGTGDDVE